MIFVKFKFDLCSDAFRVTNKTIIRNCEKGFYPVYRHAVDANPFWGDDMLLGFSGRLAISPNT